MIEVRIIDYPRLRRQYKRWRFTNVSLFEWYRNWSKFWCR